jgi:hypothetical protein
MMADSKRIEKRKKLYAQEIKYKNIYGQIIDLNCSGGVMKSSKSLMEERESLKSLKGIKKDGD